MLRIINLPVPTNSVLHVRLELDRPNLVLRYDSCREVGSRYGEMFFVDVLRIEYLDESICEASNIQGARYVVEESSDELLK
jgi:hypothetical protein